MTPDPDLVCEQYAQYGSIAFIAGTLWHVDPRVIRKILADRKVPRKGTPWRRGGFKGVAEYDGNTYSKETG